MRVRSILIYMQYCCIVVVFVILNHLIYAVIVAPRRIIGRITVFRLERRVYVINQETVFSFRFSLLSSIDRSPARQVSDLYRRRLKSLILIYDLHIFKNIKISHLRSYRYTLYTLCYSLFNIAV